MLVRLPNPNARAELDSCVTKPIGPNESEPSFHQIKFHLSSTSLANPLPALHHSSSLSEVLVTCHLPAPAPAIEAKNHCRPRALDSVNGKSGDASWGCWLQVSDMEV